MSHREPDRTRMAIPERGTPPGTDTRHAARLQLAAFALERDDPEAWLADLIDVLGLREP